VAADSVVLVNHSAPATLSLPAGADFGTGKLLYVVDFARVADTHNIIIDADGAETINGAGTFTMTAAAQVAVLWWTGTVWLVLADAGAGGGGGGLGGGSWFYAATAINPGTGWAVTAPAGLAVDTNDAELLARLFDDTTEEGIGIPVYVPATATKVSITIVCRAETGATADIGWRAYGMTTGTTPGAWSTVKELATVSVTDEAWTQSTNADIALGDLNLTAGQPGLIEITRNPGVASDLTGDAAVQGVHVEFS
jgi:hypothetical protein